ncbi:class I SAM-dependent methyltransferase [Escherichia sp. E1130]|uniref:O-methyltransferase n=2 Tax=unclassified Escherichia TaxID=2608889 RepID=UPI001080D94E|nr:class I SAM-dependent methyltransferase [Escherichia sp. E1130]TGC26064.1 methyltransferase [Escherichia sp. E1130]TLI73383.1 methyltransferase [Escherichia sp. E1130]
MNRLNNSICPIRDPQVIRVLERMNNERKHPPQELFREAPALDPERFSSYGFSIAPEQGELIYLLCRAMKATRVVDFATSVGMSALYFAAAMKDNGGGLVIGSEMVREKAEVASRNLAEAGLTSFVDIRVGDARETLKDLGGPVDFILIDGFPLADGPSLARKVTEIVAPQLRVGGYILNDNAEPDFLSYVRDPQNGFISITLPIKRGTELALKIS